MTPVRVVEETVHVTLGLVGAVGQRLDSLAHEPLGIVHERIGGGFHGGQTVALDQREVALGADPAGGDLRLHVAHHHVGRADVVAHHVPERLVDGAPVVGLESLELEPLGVGVHRIDDAAAAGAERADIEVVCGGDGVAHQRALVDDRHDEGHVRPVARAVIGGVVNDDVALVQDLAPLLEDLVHALHVAGDGPRLQRRRVLRFAELAAVAVDDRRPEILGRADDRRIGHAHELPAHLDRDVLQRALDHAGGDGVDGADVGRLCHDLVLLAQAQDQVRARVDADRPAGRHHGGGVLLHDDRGAWERRLHRRRLAPVECRLVAFERAVHAED